MLIHAAFFLLASSFAKADIKGLKDIRCAVPGVASLHLQRCLASEPFLAQGVFGKNTATYSQCRESAYELQCQGSWAPTQEDSMISLSLRGNELMGEMLLPGGKNIVMDCKQK